MGFDHTEEQGLGTGMSGFFCKMESEAQGTVPLEGCRAPVTQGL